MRTVHGALLFVALLTLTSFGTICNAQTLSQPSALRPNAQEARAVEQLRDGGDITRISGVEHHARDIAQTNAQEARVVQSLPDGGFIVRIGNIEYRAITAAQVREILERKIENERLRAENGILTEQITNLRSVADLSQRDVRLASTEAALERERAERFRVLWEGEHGLRLQAERLGNRGSISRFLDHPAMQIGLRIVVPAVQTWLDAQRR